MLTRRSLALTLLGALAAATGCDSDSPTNPNINNNPPDLRPGLINVIHAVPDAPAVDIYVDGQKAIPALDYRMSSGNVSVPAGSHQVELRPVGASAMDTPVWSGFVYVQQDRKLLLSALGRVSDSIGATKLTVTTQLMGGSDPSAVRLRLLHASPSGPAVDVASGSNVILRGASFGGTTDYVAASNGDLAGPVTLTLRASGGTDFFGSVALGGPFTAGTSLTAVVFGETDPLSADDRFFSVSVLDEGTGKLTSVPFTINTQGAHGKLYVFHAGSDAGTVDLYSKNGALLAGGLAYQKASKLLDLEPGIYQVELRPAGMATALTSANLKLLPGTDWAVFAAGLTKGAAPGQGLTLRAAPRAQKGGDSTWRLVQAVADAGAVDLKNNGPTLYARVPYGRAGAYRTDDLPAATLQLNLSANAKSAWNIVVPQTVADSAHGEVTSVYLTGTVGNPGAPLTAITVIESTASATQAPTVVGLATTVAPTT